MDEKKSIGFQTQAEAHAFMLKVNKERLTRINAMIYNLGRIKFSHGMKSLVSEARLGLFSAQAVAEVSIELAVKLDPETQGREFEERTKAAWMTVDPRFFVSDIRTPEELLKSLKTKR